VRVSVAAAPGVRLCLAVGALVLATGCALGYAVPDQRLWVLLLLAGSVLLFSTALALQWHGSAQGGRDTATPPHVQAPAAASARRAGEPTATPAARATGAPQAITAAPLSGFSGPQPAPDGLAATAPKPSAAPAPSAARAPAAAVVPVPRTDTTTDVAHLMQLPLADLLLAALCKDPDGARRIFEQAVLHSDAASAATPRPASDAPHPASSRAST
jgi:hypothetical protein